MTNIALVELARGIAIGGHAGQFDKSGKPYVTHLERVVRRLTTFEEQVLGWLHDVVEDTCVTLEDLAAAGFPESVVLQVGALTHRPYEPRQAYYARIREWPVATRVKLADVADNLDPERLAALDEKTRERLKTKYAAAIEALSG